MQHANYFDGTPEATMLRASIMWTRREGCPHCHKSYYYGELESRPYILACCECGAIENLDQKEPNA